ncbi:MAG: TnpV protein [Ruminococcus sp.]|nr:TnpV protein [Ruminococcus sp.]MBR6568427.1 TnpV protein [Clostridia bacterium]
MFSSLVEQIKNTEGFTEELTEQNQLEWAGRVNNIRKRANEIVFNELIYV